ncbi:hypothetical protein M4D51_08020 [Microbacterium sp. p3-SID338]|nr:hypothetical protein [Microbacterium sp. p3-SID338]MCT1395671.1 hypothetical protein [Microbacterium sp. p3-SID338]
MADASRLEPWPEGPDGSPEYFIRACPPSPRSVAIWAETARRLGVCDD